MSWSLLLYFVSLLVAVAGGLVLLVYSALGPLDATVVFTLALGMTAPAILLLLALLILFLIGFLALYTHRHELGGEHERNMERSFLLFIGAIVAFVGLQIVFFTMFFLALASSFFPFAPGPPAQPTPEVLREALLPALLVLQGGDIIVASLIGLLLYFPVVTLATGPNDIRLRLAVALFVLGSVGGFVAFVVLYATGNLLVPAFQDGGNFGFFPISIQYQDVLGGLLKSSLQGIAAFLFWRIYRASSDAVAESRAR